MKHVKPLSVPKASTEEAVFFQLYFMVIAFMLSAALSEK